MTKVPTLVCLAASLAASAADCTFMQLDCTGMLTPPGFMRNFGTDAAAQQKCCEACANNVDCGVAVLATDQVPFVRIACTHAHAHTHTRTLPTLSELSAMAVATHHTATLHATVQLHGRSRHSPRLQATTVIRINKVTLTSTASHPPTRQPGWRLHAQAQEHDMRPAPIKPTWLPACRTSPSITSTHCAHVATRTTTAASASCAQVDADVQHVREHRDDALQLFWELRLRGLPLACQVRVGRLRLVRRPPPHWFTPTGADTHDCTHAQTSEHGQHHIGSLSLAPQIWMCRLHPMN
jgi:hypothetical protein